jgi:ankyrin repeat protein
VKKFLYLLLIPFISSCYSVTVKNDDPSYKFFLLLKEANSDKIVNYLDDLGSSNKKEVLDGTNNPYGLPSIAVSILEKHTDLIDTLIKQGASVDAQGVNGVTALLVASQLGESDVIKKLIESYKAQPLKDKDGKNPLHYAALKVNNPSLNYLLTLFANLVNEKDNLGNTAIYYAVTINNPKNLSLLLAHKANPNIQNNSKESALSYAIHMNYDNLVKLMRTKNRSSKKRR